MDILYSRKDLPLGKTWEEWTVEWWKWVLEIPKYRNPGYDVDGSLLQNTPQKFLDPYFLVGTHGGQAKRSIHIRVGTSILMPVINVTISFAEAPHLRSRDELLDFVVRNSNDLTNKGATIDGLSFSDLEEYRVRSDFFPVNFPENNIYSVRAGPTVGIADGYWLFLRPLEAGEHTIHTFGSCLAGRIRIEVLYTISVF